MGNERVCATTRTSTSTTYQTTSSSCDSAASGSVAGNFTGLMAARTVSELANWDGRLDQQRQNSKWRRSSSSLARESYHTPLENQPIEIFQPPGRFSDQKRTEQSASRSNLERDSLVNSPENVRLPGHVDTPSTPSHDVHHYHHPSILVSLPLCPLFLSSRFAQHTVPNTILAPSPFIASSKSSHFTPNSPVLASRVHNSRPSSSREHAELLKPASTIESEVIDLTINDTDDELSVSDMLVHNNMGFSNQCADPGPSRRPSFSGHSSPLPLEQSLFTPPRPPRRRSRLFMHYLAVPAFPKGLTKADYQPLPNHSVAPPAVTSKLKDSSVAESSVTKERTPSLPRWKGKERKHDAVSFRKYEQRAHATRSDVAPSASLDAFYEHTSIPLVDGDTYPPLTTSDLATNTRFQFAHAWRGHASRLWKAELDCMFKFRLLGKASTWVRSVDASSPRIPGTAGYVSSEQLRPWELVPPDSPSRGKNTKHSLDEQADATESHSVVGDDANHLPLPDDAMPVPGIAVDQTLSNTTLSQSFSSTAVDMEHDMNQYFNGLSDSPNKHIPRPQLSPMHTFRPHLLQSAGHTQISPLELGFPSLEPDPRLADKSGHECFLGVPPSPTTADVEPLTAPLLTPDSPFEPVDNFTTSLSNLFAGEALMDAWSFEQGEGLLPDNDSASNDHVPPAALGTIDPSLLGPEQPQTTSRASKDTTLKRRPKLPEPVIYIRRPIDSSALPLVSGKRPVQIKYRDSDGSPAAPSTQSASKQASSQRVEHPVELSTNDTHDPPRVKRCSVPSRKRREYHTTSESESGYIPETSKPKLKLKLKLKRPSVRDEETLAEDPDTGAGTVPTMSFCHQCRHKSDRPKMLCSNMVDGRACGKRFCNRCILHRYPDVTFDQHSAGFLCPACTNTCNCSACSRNRGEEFISMRLGGLAASLFKTKVTLVRDVGKPLHHVKSPRYDGDARRSASEATTPTPESSALPMQSQFWAHVYGMEGERMGSAFMTRELSLSQPLPKPLPPTKEKEKIEKPRRRREKKREKMRMGPRVFIGLPLASWKVRAVRDLEPSVDVKTIWDKDKDKVGSGLYDDQLVPPAAGASRRRRCYVGHRVPLHEPYGRMPGTTSPTITPVFDSDGSLTPLSELEGEGKGVVEAGADYWPQPEVGEYCLWAPPPPPGTIVRSVSSGPSGLAGPSLPGVDAGIDDVGRQGLGLGLTSDVAVAGDVAGDVEMGVGVAANGDEQALSDEDMVRAISAALAALSNTQP
ncbi:hypothetical protein J3R82DRAFT_2033 [Butyriboletus roseoflavus]|nr:hypothetical protein J3R82DRAFT_2033 [Butyriboletus roseoflavus]